MPDDDKKPEVETSPAPKSFVKKTGQFARSSDNPKKATSFTTPRLQEHQVPAKREKEQ